MSTKLSDISVGSSVCLNVNGTQTEFLVVHQGLPSSLYDSSCDGTWLLMKDIYEERAWDSSNNDYANSDIHAYLNGTFLGMFDSDIQSAIKQVKIPYRAGSGTSTTVTSGSSGLSAKVFLLSYTEVGLRDGSYAPVEGAVLSHFKGAAAADRIAYLNGSANSWWIRSPRTNGSSRAWSITSSGSAAGYSVTTNTNGVRPALVLPSTLSVSGDGTIVVATIGIQGNVAVDGVQKDLTGESYVNIGGEWKEIVKSYANINGIWKPTCET